MATAVSAAPRGLRNDAERYGRVAQIFHWTVAVLIVAAIALGLALDNWPRGSATHDAVIFVHKSIGVTVLLLAVLRVSWLLRSPAPPAADRLATWERRLSWAVHKLLYLAMFAMPLSGMLLSQAVGKPVTLWGIGPLPQIVPFDPAIPVVQSPWVIAGGIMHTVIFKLALFAALALHVAGALKHALFDRDPAMFRRMWGR